MVTQTDRELVTDLADQLTSALKRVEQLEAKYQEAINRASEREREQGK